MIDLKEEFISDILNFEEIEENMLIDSKNHFLFKKGDIKIIILKNKDICYIFDKNKEIKIEKSKIDDEIFGYVICQIYRKYKVKMEVIAKILFSPFLWNFMKIADKKHLHLAKNRWFNEDWINESDNKNSCDNKDK